MSSIQQLLDEVQHKANNQLELLFDKLVERILNPPISAPNGSCRKHTELNSAACGLGVLRTRYKRLYYEERISDERWRAMNVKYQEARSIFKKAICTCADGLPPQLLSSDSECSKCGEQYHIQNNCKQPIHMQFKRGEIPQTSWTNGNMPIAFDIGSG